MSTFDYISRAEWGAEPPRSVVRLSWGRISKLYVHYTSMESDQVGDPRARMRGVQHFHKHTKGWLDFAYSWAFSVSGLILEGRGWGIQTGATGTENPISQAVVFLGGDKAGRDDVTPRGREALGKLIRRALELKKAADGGTLEILGHREAPGNPSGTACPGLELMNYIQLKGWEIVTTIKYPRNAYLFFAWYLGEGDFKKYGPHNLKYRPKQLPGRFTPQTAALMVALRHYLSKRKK